MYSRFRLSLLFFTIAALSAAGGLIFRPQTTFSFFEVIAALTVFAGVLVLPSVHTLEKNVPAT